MKTHWFVFSMNTTHWKLSTVFCHSWLILNILSEVSDFGSSLFPLFCLLSRQTFFYSACSWSLFVQPFLPRPHLPFFLTSACSSPVPLSSLCAAVECLWVLAGSPASTASQIPGLAALHTGCCTHATRHHSQKGGGKKKKVQYFREPPGCAICLS